MTDEASDNTFKLFRTLYIRHIIHVHYVKENVVNK